MVLMQTTVEDIRWLRCDIKSLNLLGNVLAKEYAVKYNAGEAIQHRGKLLQKALLVMYMRLKMVLFIRIPLIITF